MIRCFLFHLLVMIFAIGGVDQLLISEIETALPGLSINLE